jgi:hypothetical protein
MPAVAAEIDAGTDLTRLRLFLSEAGPSLSLSLPGSRGFSLGRPPRHTMEIEAESSTS